ncbi:hypothetical protein V8G54_026153 [Vigna mungo]
MLEVVGHNSSPKTPVLLSPRAQSWRVSVEEFGLKELDLGAHLKRLGLGELDVEEFYTQKDLMSNIEDNKDLGQMDVDASNESANTMPSSQKQEEAVKKKYGGMLPKKPPLISKDHERAYFDSADWALGKQGGEKPKGPLEALRPKLQVLNQFSDAWFGYSDTAFYGLIVVVF